jgi:hypothetical protein
MRCFRIVPDVKIRNWSFQQDFVKLAMRFLDVFFTVFHTLLIFFNLFGWIWKRTRRINLVCLLLTAGSWLILGIFYGIGYCPLTDWHFAVLERLGYTDLPSSYISFLVHRLTGLQPDQ